MSRTIFVILLLVLFLMPTGINAAGCLGGTSPLVIDLDGGVFRFTGPDQPVSFDIDGDGLMERISWTEPGAGGAFLVLDRNGNGRIDSGIELFGSATPQPLSLEPQGYIALRVFDESGEGGNGDGYISDADGVWESLQLWLDDNHDGISQPDELTPIPLTGVRAIDLEYRTSRRRDRNGNLLRYTSAVHFEDHSRPAAVDVIFVLAE